MVFGSLVSGTISRKFIETGSIPFGAFGMALSLILIPFSSSLEMVALLLFIFGFAGGLVMVPLNSLIQLLTPNRELGTVLAGSNFMQNLFMFIFLIITAIFGYFNFDSVALLYLISVIALGGFIYTLIKMPQAFVRFILRIILSLRYKIRVDGVENLEGRKGFTLEITSLFRLGMYDCYQAIDCIVIYFIVY